MNLYQFIVPPVKISVILGVLGFYCCDIDYDQKQIEEERNYFI